MQAHLRSFSLAKIVFITQLVNKKFPFMLPSHNCIIIDSMFSFQGALLSSFSKKLNEASTSLKLQSIPWWRVPGSNRWPPACKAGALPAELTPHIVEIKPTICDLKFQISNLFCGFVSPLKSKPASLGFWFVLGTFLEVVGQNGLAFLRESHGGYNMPPACCQEPPFEPFCLEHSLNFRSGGPKWTRTIDLTIISRVL